MASAQGSGKEEHSQRLLWLTLLLSLSLAFVFKSLGLTPIPISYLPRQLIAALIFATGLSLRYVAVKQLGGFFTTDVMIQHEHELITDGPYRRIRHPAYTGLIIAFTGIGIAMGDFIALLTLTIPTVVALNYRIEIEEKFLVKQFGKQYVEYCKSTNKLFPKVKKKA